MPKFNQLLRYSRIINKLNSGIDFIPADELLAAAGGDDPGDQVTLRTLQRDIDNLEQLFGIDIKFRRGQGYYIVSQTPVCEAFDRLLTDFTLLSGTGAEGSVKGYVLPEHRRMVFSIDVGALLGAIRDCRVIEFTYFLPRQDKEIRYRVCPHYIKESQLRWYLIGFNEDDEIRIFELGRFRNLNVTGESFTRRDDVDVSALFQDCFGIWYDPDIPVEDVDLRFDALDARFIKTLPIHESQSILDEQGGGITVRVRLRITNDFVMELLSRSRSVEVLAPEHLRKRIHDIYEEALKRNCI